MIPEHLVAIASAGECMSWGIENRRDSTTPPELSSKRMHSVLDALASLCVRAGKGEVYAVGLQLLEINGGPSGKIILTIAGNGNVPVEVSSHLRALWIQLQDIARVCYKYYKDQGTPYPITYNEDSPPSKNTLNDASEMLQRLKMNVFRHSFRKFVARVNKHYNAFLEFSARLTDYWLQQPESNKDAQKNFELAARAIRIIKRMVSRGVDHIDLDRLLPVVDTLQSQVRVLVKSRLLLSWCIGVAESKSRP